MGFTKAGAAGAARLDLDNDRVAADSDGMLEEATRARVRRVCSFVNAEIGRWRGQLIGIGAACLVAMVLVPIVTGIVDERVAVVVVVGIMGFWLVRARRELASSYRNIAVKRLVAATSKELVYKSRSSLTREQFVSLDLIRETGSGWRSVHEIAGRAGGTTFSLYDVHVPGRERGADAFRGVVICVNFPTPFSTHTVVLPERGDHSAGAGHGTAKRDLVLLKNPAFEQLFSTYSTDYSQARRLLTARLMKILIRATETFGPDIRLAFVRRSLFVAVSNARLFPEISLFSAPLTPEVATGALVRLAEFAGGLARAAGSD